MIKFLLSTIVIAFQISANAAVSFDVVGPCSEQPILSVIAADDMDLPNVGSLTIVELSKSRLKFIGSDSKIESIDGTPVGEAAIELISRSEMRAYGWCFYVNDEQPDVYPNEIKMSKDVQSVKWIFGYAHYLDGEWLSMCEPSWKLKPKFLCDK